MRRLLLRARSTCASEPFDVLVHTLTAHGVDAIRADLASASPKVQVCKTQDAGLGLFAAIDIEADSVLTECVELQSVVV